MMDEQTKKAFDFASDITKQLITVAAAIVTLTVTFSKDTPAPARAWAYWAWFAFLVSIVLGFATLMSLAGELQPKPVEGVAAAGNPAPSIWKKNVTLFSIAQMLIFLIAVGLTTRFGAVAMSNAEKPTNPPPQICNCVLPAAPPTPDAVRGATNLATPAPSGARRKSPKKISR
jgi:hypothetical protein